MSFKKELTLGVFYTAITKYSGIVLNIVITAVLARLVGPEDFGVIGIATVFITFFGLFSEFGLSAAVVQRKDLNNDNISDIFSFTFYLGIILGILFFCASDAIGDYYNSNKLSTVCKILSISLTLGSLNIVPNALIGKEKEFKFIAERTLSIQIICGIISIIAAFKGLGVYALIISSILGNLLVFIVSYLHRPIRLKFKFNIKTLLSVASYSLYQFAFSILNYFGRNLDNILTGKYISLSQLGYYQKAYGLMLMPVSNITNVITPALHPILSDYQNDLEFIKSKLLSISKILAIIGFPVGSFLFFSAKEIILIVYGSQWTPVIPVFKILALSIGIQIVGCTQGSIYQAANNTKWMSIWGVISVTKGIVILILALAIWGTISAVAWSITISAIIDFITGWPILFHSVFKCNSIPIFRVCFKGIILSLFLGVILFILSAISFNLNIIISLTFKTIVSTIFILLSLQLTNTLNVKVLLKNIFNRIHK